MKSQPCGGLWCPVWVGACESPPIPSPTPCFLLWPRLARLLCGYPNLKPQDHCISSSMYLEDLSPDLCTAIFLWLWSCQRWHIDSILSRPSLSILLPNFSYKQALWQFLFLFFPQPLPQNSLEYKFHGDSVLKFLLSSLSLELWKKNHAHCILCLDEWNFFFNIVWFNRLRWETGLHVDFLSLILYECNSRLWY